MIVGNIYLRYYTPIYKASAELLLHDSKKGGSSDDILSALKTNSNNINIDNEIEILKSRTTMINIVNKLTLNIYYTIEGRFKQTELYSNKPFEFVKVDTFDGYYSCKVNILNDKQYQLTDAAGKVIKANWGDTIKLPEIGKVYLKKTSVFSVASNDYTVSMTPALDVALGMLGSVNYGIPNKSASCILITMVNTIPERAVDVINKLMEVYKEKNVEDRTRVATNTIDFIDERISILGLELSDVEQSIVKFKQDNSIADMPAQATLVVNAKAGTASKLEEAQIQLELIGSISDYLQKVDDRTMTLPASLLDNPGLSELMNRYNTLATKIDNALVTMTPINPIPITLMKQKDEVKRSLAAALASSKKEMELKVQKIKSALGMNIRDIREVPSVEREYLEFSRKQQIKQ